MDDRLISLNAAINAICEDGTRIERQGRYSMTMVERKQRDVDILENLPSAQPMRKRGKWIVMDDMYNRISGRCSICGWEAHMYEDDVVGMDYCPNCGADMRRERQDV